MRNIVKNLASKVSSHPKFIKLNKGLKWAAVFASPVFLSLIVGLAVTPPIQNAIYNYEVQVALAELRIVVAKAAETEAARKIAEAEVMKENNCLVEAVYNESDPYNLADMDGRADVIFSRMASGLFPKTICGVVNQVSYDKDGTPTWQWSYHAFKKHAKSGPAYAFARLAAIRYWTRLLEGEVKPTGALWTHAWYMTPYWVKIDVPNCRMEPMGRVGAHFQYGLRTGQSKTDCLAALGQVVADNKDFKALPKKGPVPKSRPANSEDEVASLVTAKAG